MTRAARKDGLFEPNLFLQYFLTGQPLNRLLDRAVASSGVRGTEYAVLSAVDELEPVAPADIARLTGMPRPTLTPVIEQLTSKGLVQRTQHPHDGRSYMLTLTTEGRRIKQQNGQALADVMEQLQAQLGDAAEEMVTALRMLRNAAEMALDVLDSGQRRLK